jgi:serine/threonine protein kinase
MICPACQADNDEAAEVCFTCRAVLSAVTQGSIIGGRYEVVRLLGRGGMGTVYEAHDRVLDERVAVKVLRADVASAPGMERRFRSEIKLSRRVSHWNVCRIHEYGEEGALQFISMELLDGRNLKERLRSEGPLDAEAAYRLAIEAAEGLEAIHRVGIIHRDLKPANIMITTDGAVRLMDFGIAKPASAEPTVAAPSGYVLGTPEYMSPEQARGRPVDFRSDLYSLGILIYEAVTGRVPFRGDSPVSTLMMQAEDPPPLEGPAAARIPPPLVPVLRRVLAKRPEDRFASAGELAVALRAARAASLGADAVVADPATAQLAHAMPRPAAWLVFLVLVVAAGAYLGLRYQAAVDRTDLPSAVPAPSSPARSLASPTPQPTRAASAPSQPRDAPVEESPISRARPSPAPRASAPAARSIAPSPSPALVGRSPEPVPTPTVSPRPPETSASPEPAPATPGSSKGSAPVPATGWLLVLVTPWADVSVDGVVVGQTPLPRIPVTAGTHSVLLTHPAFQPYPWKPTVAAGQTAKLVVNLESDAVRKKP